VSVLLNAIALWFTVSIVSGVDIVPFAPGEIGQQIVTYLFVAFVFGVVNTIIGPVLRIISIPLYILTLGLFSVIVNAALLSIVVWLSGAVGFGLAITEFFWAGVVGAFVLGIANWVLGIIFKPALKK
jgi:putative membrane protein